MGGATNPEAVVRERAVIILICCHVDVTIVEIVE